MLKKISVLAVTGAFVFSLSACGKKQAEQPAAPAANPAPNVALPQKGQETTVSIPSNVESQWKAIKVTVETKKTGAKKEYEIKLGSSMDVPGTKISIKAMEFAPAFVMQGLNITSSSAEPTNPAAKVVITDGGKEVFKGWLFQRFPTTHAFSHPDYAITLTGWVHS